jgi:mannose-6-phosphate isomerase
MAFAMTTLYPLLMRPMFDPRPWGTQDLSPVYPGRRFEEKIGEAWLTGDESQVANGPLAGKSLAEVSSQFKRDLVGGTAPAEGRFPLLLKFLFPHEKLSVQVHPDDEAARCVGLPCGKTECWYVAYAKPGAQIALGFAPGVTSAQFEESVHAQRAESLLNWVNVSAGDMIYVAGGTVHTLGPGAIIVETQQQSDTTYRLYDYGRPRELHLKQGLAVVKERVASGKVQRPAPVELNGGKNRQSPLIAAPYFVVDRFELKDPLSLSTQDDSGKSSVQILVAVDGCASIEAENAPAVTLTKGDAVVIPANTGKFSIHPQWQIELLKAYVPGKQLPEPATRL